MKRSSKNQLIKYDRHSISVGLFVFFFSMFSYGDVSSSSNQTINEEYQKIWSDLIESLEKQKNPILPAATKEKIKQAQVFLIDEIKKDKGANRFSGFYIKDKNTILINQTEIENRASNPERIKLLLMHEGLQSAGEGDVDYLSTVLLNTFADTANNHSDLPQNISNKNLLDSMNYIFESDTWKTRLQADEFYGWNSLLSEQKITIEEDDKINTLSSGTYVGGEEMAQL